MKLMWFHLMPYTELPDDFRREEPVEVWVDIHSSLFDPRRAHHMLPTTSWMKLEYAAECGFDAICVNEHHSNGYGLMPSPNLIASSLARRTKDTALCVLGNSLALYNPRDAGRRRVRDDRLRISGGRLIAGFPVGSPMDTCTTPMARTRRCCASAISKRTISWSRRGPSRRPLRSTAAITSSATSTSGRARSRRSRISADLDPRRRISVEDVAVVRREGLRLLLPVLLRLQGRQIDDGRVLGRDGEAGQGPGTRTAPGFCNSSGSPRRASRRWSSMPSRPSISMEGACISTRASPARPVTRPRKRSAAASRAWSRRPPTTVATRSATRRSSLRLRARWMPSSTRRRYA